MIYTYTFTNSGPVNILDEHELNNIEVFVDNLPTDATAVVFRSDKKDFVVGANVKSFLPIFEKGENAVIKAVTRVNSLFNKIRNLECPTFALVNGQALGGGLEIALACDFRIANTNAKLGVPEVKLGLIPGWGGATVLPRMIGMENATTWITTGKSFKANDALKVGVVDMVVETFDGVVETIVENIETYNVADRRIEKLAPMTLSLLERTMAIETIKGAVLPKAKGYPAPKAFIKCMEKSVTLPFEKALKEEAKTFAKLAVTDEASNLVNLFLGMQKVKKQYKEEYSV